LGVYDNFSWFTLIPTIAAGLIYLMIRKKWLNIIKDNYVLYGHTHIQREEYRDGVYMICPGALDNYAEKPGYAIIDITEKGIVPNLLRL